MTSTMNEKKITALYAAVGVESLDDLAAQAKGIGPKIGKAEDILASARTTLASLLPILLAYSIAAYVAGEKVRAVATVTGVKEDQAGMNVIAGALLAQGYGSAEQCRADVIAAVRNGASKPALREAALQGSAAFRAVAKDAAHVAASKTAKGTESAPKTDDDDADVTTGTTTVTATASMSDLIVALSGPASAIVKAHHAGTALSESERANLRKILAALIKETDLFHVKTAPVKTAKTA